MLILITYDVNTQTEQGKRRLTKVAKQCKKYGQRVQNSVFECDIDPQQYSTIKHDLQKIIDTDTDSLRFYNLGDHYQKRIEHIGANPAYDPESVLIV